jgi:hypothetical protein
LITRYYLLPNKQNASKQNQEEGKAFDPVVEAARKPGLQRRV